MRLGEAVVGERRHLHEQLLGDLAGDPTLGHPVEQPLLELLHPLPAALGAHRLAQLVGLARREPGDVDRHLHQLLLEQRHPERLAQAVLEQRVQVRDRLLPVAAADVRVHRPALDRAGADQRDLDDEVVEPRAACSRGSVAIWARLSIWNTPTVSARQSIAYTSSSCGMVARSTS